jgi:Family of unknown function (DUF6084)
VSEEAVQVPPVPGAVPPAPSFEVLSVAPVPHAAAPTLRFRLRVTDVSGRDVHAIALTAQIVIDPARRAYDPATRERLEELFGAPERWGVTTHSFPWTQVGTLVTNFTGAVEFGLDVACTYDLELAAAKYFYALAEGEVPLSFHFTGTILYAGERERLQVVRVPWSCTSRWRMPVVAWRALMDAYYPGGGWIRLHTATLDALHRRRAAQGFASFDACVADLLRATEEGGA